MTGLFSQALAHHQGGRLAEAEALYRKILEGDPGHPDSNNNLAVILRRRGELGQARACYERALPRAGDPAAVLSNYGCLLIDLGHKAEAEAALRRAIVLKPSNPEAQFNLGNLLLENGDRDRALALFEAAVRGKPALAEAHNNAGIIHKGRGALEAASAAFVAAVRAQPGLAAAYCNLGETLKEQGRVADAVAVFQKGLEADPGHVLIHSNLVFALNYTPLVTVDAVAWAHRDWAARHADPLLPAGKRHGNDRDPGRRLRVGYVSPDFATHSVSFFAEPLIAGHDRREVEVFCYAEEWVVDATTHRLRGLADHWRSIRGVDDDAVAAQIEADGIDILVDLAGHTAHHRLLVLARKPAPVQVTWLGYPNTTGMRAVDYRLTDGVAEPVDGPHTPGSETPVRLPQGFHRYSPPAFAPDCDPLPALAGGRVTFGSFNNIAKVTPEVVRVWAEVLHRVPGSRLLVKSASFIDRATRERYAGLFAARGITADRLDLLARIEPAQNHLKAYGRIDIALDPFPYNGTTTTCEALWMGVPVVTLAGASHVGRVGMSLLTQCGLTDLIAESEAAYVAKAAALAADLAGLAERRAGLRARFAASPLTDYAGFARQVEAAYRDMWHRWLRA